MASADTFSTPHDGSISSAVPSIVPRPVEETPNAPTASVTSPSRSPHANTASRPGTLVQIPAAGHHVAKYLFSSERYVGEWRHHWIILLFWVPAGLLVPFPAGYAAAAAHDYSSTAAAAVIGALVLLEAVVSWHVIEWWHSRFVLTNKRVMLITGLISRRVAMMPLARVTDMAYEQSPLGRVLNYGSFILESAGQDQALSTIEPLPHPREVYLLFCQEMYDPDGW